MPGLHICCLGEINYNEPLGTWNGGWQPSSIKGNGNCLRPIYENIACTNATYKQALSHYKVCSPKVGCHRKHFLAYKYMFQSEIYIFERKPFKKIYDHHFKILIFISRVARQTLMFLICFCYCVHVSFFNYQTSTYVGVLKVSTLGTLTLCYVRWTRWWQDLSIM